MRFCIPYFRRGKYLQSAEEIKINYDNSKIDSLSEFLANHSKQRVILDTIGAEMTLKDYAAMAEIIGAANVAIRLEREDADGAAACKQYHLPFFFYDYCYDFDIAIDYARFGVSDIYVTDELCFHLDEVKKYIKDKYHCNIRVYPNIGQSSSPLCEKEKLFFIRPEELRLYEDYIDVIEFYDSDTKDKVDKLYKIYALKHKYEGPLIDLIPNGPNVQNECVPIEFGTSRQTCGRRCKKWSKCTLCTRYIHLAQTLHAKKYVIKIEKT